MSQLTQLSHPVVQHHLAALRDAETEPAEFRRLVRCLTSLLACAATEDLALQDCTVQTPLVSMTGRRLSQRIGLVPILRAGIGMVEPFLDLVPSAEVWHLGLYRDEETAQPVHYYDKLPADKPVDVAFVVDPMLATGGSAVAALTTLTNWGVTDLRLLSLIAAPEGVEEVQGRFPDVKITVCVIDECLNEQKFIVPGLGDAGDRIFNTQG
ncbi:MAG: uracil phosphoribosyltransferase, partial [Pirellulaceae bacterium]|nr:uracil phosphoribosyltransferase [Pirellulaceae bacterium]